MQTTFTEKIILEFFTPHASEFRWYNHPWFGDLMVTIKVGKKEKTYVALTLAKNILRYKKGLVKQAARIEAKGN